MGNYKGIAYREQAQVVFIDLSASATTGSRSFKKVPLAGPEILRFLPWSPWGEDNLFPQRMVADIESCGILNSIIDGVARFGLCEGLAPAIVERNREGKIVVKEFINDPEIDDFLEMNNHFLQSFGWFKDFGAFGNMGARYLLNGGRDRIVRFERFDFSEMRYQKMDDSGNIANIYLSGEWDKVRSEKDTRVVTVPLLDAFDPVAELVEKAKAGMAEHAMTVKYPSWGKHYYGMPLWYAAHDWVKIAQGVPVMKAALFQNTMRLKKKVTIFPGYWLDAFPGQWDKFTDEEKEAKREELYDDINNYLVGAKNAHKTLFTDGVYDRVTGKQYSNILIEEVPDNTVQGDLLPDSAAANSEIAFSELFNPSIIGASLPSGPYTNSQGGSNIREALLMQVILREFERRQVQHLMNVPKRFNGWDKRHASKGKLEFVIPATILTTTDTGGSVKPTIQSSDANKNNSGDKGGDAPAGEQPQ